MAWNLQKIFLFPPSIFGLGAGKDFFAGDYQMNSHFFTEKAGGFLTPAFFDRVELIGQKHSAYRNTSGKKEPHSLTVSNAPMSQVAMPSPSPSSGRVNPR